MLTLFAETDVKLSEVQQGYGNLIFTGVFVLLVILAGIWWLRRG